MSIEDGKRLILISNAHAKQVICSSYTNTKIREVIPLPDPLVSIVVPIYKVEQVLERCLDSIVAQAYRPLEVILVNDGSPDRCGEIIRRYEDEWPFIRSIWQENSGVSAARNAGIAGATGEYIALIDSDDYVEPGFIRALVRAAQSKNADVAVCDFYFTFRNGLDIPFPLLTFQRDITGEKAAKMSMRMLTVTPFVWNKLYRRELFTESGIQFPPIYYEDIASIPQVLAKAGRVALIHRPYYHYCLRRSGITGNFRMKNIVDYLKAVDIIRRFLWEKGLWDDWKVPYRAMLRAAEAVLLVEVSLQRNSFPEYRRRHLIRLIHSRLRRMRLPPANAGPAPAAPAEPIRK
jgi:glycosyltransferase involved in cell wall biosynthesis